MNDTDIAQSDSFDLAGTDERDAQDFVDTMGDILMQRILRKAWAELDSGKRDVLTHLLEESKANPDDSEKQEAVFSFLDTHVTNLPEFVARELDEIQTTYRETRDQLRDSAS